MTACVDIADGVVLIVACPEVRNGAGIVLSVFGGGLLGIFPVLATPTFLLLSNRFCKERV